MFIKKKNRRRAAAFNRFSRPAGARPRRNFWRLSTLSTRGAPVQVFIGVCGGVRRREEDLPIPTAHESGSVPQTGGRRLDPRRRGRGGRREEGWGERDLLGVLRDLTYHLYQVLVP